MKRIKTQLKTISKSLASLSKQVDSITKQVDKLQPAKKAAPAKRKKTVRKAAVRKKAVPAKGQTVLDKVYAVIKRSKTGASIATLKTKTGLDFWASTRRVEELYGTPDLKVNYDSFILNSYFYFNKGITFNLREDNYRTAHIYRSPPENLLSEFKDQF